MDTVHFALFYGVNGDVSFRLTMPTRILYDTITPSPKVHPLKQDFCDENDASIKRELGHKWAVGAALLLYVLPMLASV